MFFRLSAMNIFGRCVLLVTMLLTTLSRSVAAQEPSRGERTTFQVLIRSDSGRFIEGAGVRLRVGKVDRQQVSGQNGSVVFDSVTPGRAELTVRAIGFKPTSLYVTISAGVNAVTVNLANGAVVLEDIRVVGGRQVLGRHEDFDDRVRRGDASAFVTQAEIEQRNPASLSQLLRRLPGVRIADSLGSVVVISTRGQKLSRGAPVQCVMRITVDGVILSASTSLDAVIPKDVYGVELYYGPSRVPPALAGSRTDSWCGLVAIWTR